MLHERLVRETSPVKKGGGELYRNTVGHSTTTTTRSTCMQAYACGGVD